MRSLIILSVFGCDPEHRRSTCTGPSPWYAHKPARQAARHGFSPVCCFSGCGPHLGIHSSWRRGRNRQAISRLGGSKSQPGRIMLRCRVVLVGALLRMAIGKRSPMCLTRARFTLPLSHSVNHLTLPLGRDTTDHRVHTRLLSSASNTDRGWRSQYPILHDRPPMNTAQKALDDTESDEASDIDPFDRLCVVDCPLVNSDARPQCRVELEENGP